MLTTIVTLKGQIVIPSKIRRRMNIKKGTKLLVEEKENEIILRPLTRSYFSKMAGQLPTRGKLTEALLRERKDIKLER
jgi:AbrB family looped-hinge helix DNA binding protein